MDSDFFLLLQLLLCFVLNLLINVLFLLTVIYMKVKKLLFVLYVLFFLAYDLCKAESLQGNPADGSTTRSKETITIQKITRNVRYLENNINKLG